MNSNPSQIDTTSIINNNRLEPVPEQAGKIYRIEKKNLKPILTPCRDGHDYHPDPTEDHPTMYGVKCSKCGIGRLLRKS